MNKSYKDLLNKNAKDSFYTYLSKSTEPSTAARAVSTAAINERLTSTDYGALAERLSKSGLSGSGYEEYLKRENKRKKDSALASAEGAEAQSEARARMGYEKYVSEYEKLQSKISDAVIEHFSARDGVSLEDAYSYAVGRGLSEDHAYYTAAAAVRAASEAAVKKIIAFADKHHLTAKQARRYARNSGLDERYVKQVYEAALSLSEEERIKYSTMSPNDYINYIKTMKG